MADKEGQQANKNETIQRLDSKSFEHQELEAVNRQLVQKIKILEGSLMANKQVADRYSKENTELRQERDELQSALKEAQQLNEDLNLNQGLGQQQMNQLRQDFAEQKAKMLQIHEKQKREWQSEKQRLQQNFNTSRMNINNQKQRLELELNAMKINLDKRTTELEMMRVDMAEAIEEKDLLIQKLTNDVKSLQTRLNNTIEELNPMKRNYMELSIKYQELVQIQRVSREQHVKNQELIIELEHKCSQQKENTKAFMESLEKDVQRTVEMSMMQMVQDLEFYKSQYHQMRNFLHETKNLLKSRGHMEQWINSIFPQ